MKTITQAQKSNHLLERIESLSQLQKKLENADSDEARLAILDSESIVETFLQSHPIIERFLVQTGVPENIALKSVIAIGQGPIVINLPEKNECVFPKLQRLAEQLVPVESFYDAIGGIVGYHVTVLRLIQGEDLSPFSSAKGGVRYSQPAHINLQQPTEEVYGAIREALTLMQLVSEIYVVGGAGDRFDLRDNTTGEPLPVARLRFQGRTLLEGLFRDVQSREYLRYKLFGDQIITPIAMMTSSEKNNDQHIRSICQDHDWFGRPQDSIKLFPQPVTPVVTENGDWSLKGPLELTLKPGGHGMLWKLAEDKGIFDWLENRGITKALVRQINNPVANTDYGIIAFLGFGVSKNKSFGMASCDRHVNRAEGMSALIETHSNDNYEYRLSNIEYTELAKRGIKDLPCEGSDEISVFPANTNILFADIATIRHTLKEHPLPGLLINMKTKAPLQNQDWSVTQVPAGRLETMMQNIADFIVDIREKNLLPEEQANLSTFATYNHRSKTLSVTKNSLKKGESIGGTPEGCFYDMHRNYHELLEKHCGWKMPRLPKGEEFTINPPAFIVDLHPAIGPLFHVITQKLRGGTMNKGSELRLEISEVDIEGLSLNGSFCIHSDHIFGHRDINGITNYSEAVGKCTLYGVTVRNKGIDTSHKGPYWSNAIRRHEELKIVLHGNGEFHANDIVFEGDHTIEVADGERVVASMGSSGEIVLERTRISKPTWYWKYTFGENNEIILQRCSS